MTGQSVFTGWIWLAFLFVVLVPIGWSPLAWNMQWADIIFVGLLIGLVAAGKIRDLGLKRLDIFIGLYLLAAVLSVARSSDVAQGVFELSKQAYLVSIYVVFIVIGRQKGLMARVVVWCSWTAVVLAAYSILALLTYVLLGIKIPGIVGWEILPGLGSVARIKGSLLTPGFFCNYLTFAVPMLIGLAINSSRRGSARWWKLGVCIVTVAALCTVTYSIAGFVAAGLFSVWRLWETTRRLRLLRIIALTAFLLLLIVMNFSLMVSIRQASWIVDVDPGVAQPADTYSFQEEGIGARRLMASISYNPVSYGLLKKVALEAFQQNPFTGVGLGAFHAQTEQAYQKGAIHAPYRKADPHCELLGRLAETGIIGGITLMLVWLGVIQLGHGLTRKSIGTVWMYWAFWGGFMGILVNSINVDIMNFRFLWLGLGLLRGQLERPSC